ncbi:MAG: YcxB family protein [Longibaculum sp.]
MEEVQYENHFEWTKPLLLEQYKISKPWKFPRWISIFIGLIIHINLLLNLVFFFRNGNNLSFLVIFFLFVIMYWMFPFLVVDLKSSQTKKKYGDVKKDSYYFEEEHIRFVDEFTQSENFITYKEITHLRDTKSFYVLKMGPKKGLFLYKNGFTKGNMNEFVSFVKEQVHKSRMLE